MALIVTDNSVRQINAALLSLEKKIGETNSEKAQDKQVVQMELKNVQYDFMAPLYQSGNSVSINTTGTWEGNARSATTAEHAFTADNVEHADTATSADTATTATTATNANITKTTDTVNGDKLQIGSGTAQNVTNAKHAATAEHAITADTATSADTATTATTATSANLSKTLDTVNGDKLQIGSGTAQNVTNAKHAATADNAANAEHASTADNGVPTYSTSDAGKNLAVNSSGNAVGWVKPQTIKFVDYRTDSLTFSSLTDQKKIELSNFGPEVTENNVLNFMTIYWSNIHVIAQADWSKSQGTSSSGMACALHSLNTGTGYAVIRCVYLA